MAQHPGSDCSDEKKRGGGFTHSNNNALLLHSPFSTCSEPLYKYLRFQSLSILSLGVGVLLWKATVTECSVPAPSHQHALITKHLQANVLPKDTTDTLVKAVVKLPTCVFVHELNPLSHFCPLVLSGFTVVRWGQSSECIFLCSGAGQ